MGKNTPKMIGSQEINKKGYKNKRKKMKKVKDLAKHRKVSKALKKKTGGPKHHHTTMAFLLHCLFATP